MLNDYLTQIDHRAIDCWVDEALSCLQGLIVKDRPEGGLNKHKERFAQARAPVRTLAEVVEIAKPSVLIGEINIIICRSQTRSLSVHFWLLLSSTWLVEIP